MRLLLIDIVADLHGLRISGDTERDSKCIRPSYCPLSSDVCRKLLILLCCLVLGFLDC